MSLMNKVPADPKSPTDGGEGGNDTDNKANPNPGEGGEGNGGEGGDNEERDFKVARPDNVPEKFWDPDKATVRTDDLLKSYTELEKSLSKAKEKPKAPDNYDYKVPEKLRNDYGLNETISEDDPYFAGYKKFAKEQGLSQEQFSNFVDFYLDMELSQGNSNMTAEFAKLGSESEAIKRIKNLRVFGNQYLSKESNAVLASLVNSAASVKLFEELANIASKGRQPADADTHIEDDLSDDKVDALMKSEAYWNKGHPEYKETRRKVDEAFKRQETGKRG